MKPMAFAIGFFDNLYHNIIIKFSRGVNMKNNNFLYILLLILAIMLTLTAFAQDPLMYTINVYAMPILLIIFIFFMVCDWDSSDDHDSNDEK